MRQMEKEKSNTIITENLKLVIFDFDGTLADTQTLILKTMMMAFDEMGMEPRTREQCAAMIGLPLTRICEVLYHDDSVELAERFAATYRHFFAVNNKPGVVTAFPGVKQTLQQMKQNGLLLSVATSRTHVSLNQLATDLEINTFFDFMLGCEDVDNAKPHPEPVFRTLKALKVKPSETLVVGDAVYDILMGQRAGCYTCGVTYGNGTLHDIQSVNPTFIIHSFPQLLHLL